MGLLSDIFDLITNISESSYVESSKDWADDIWYSASEKRTGVLYLSQVDDKLYRYMQIRYKNDTIAVFSSEQDNGCSLYSLSKRQQKRLKGEGCLVIKRFVR